MAPSILIVGATGNTGRSVVETLSHLSQTTTTLSNHRILALTRSSNSAAAQHLASLPNVQISHQNWLSITPSWLRSHNITRAFIAPPPTHPAHFAEESAFHLAALEAGVEYIVRISTTAANVRPDSRAHYARSHWAIEALLGSEAFAGLRWTSLQSNVFAPLYLGNAVGLIKRFRETGEVGGLRLMAARDGGLGIIDPDEVGVVAARLLALDDTAVHNKAKYVLNGPEDITGAQIVEMVERCIGVRVDDVRYKDLGFVDEMADAAPRESRSVILSAKFAMETAWEGRCTASTTSKEVLELAAPVRTPADVFRDMLEAWVS